ITSLDVVASVPWKALIVSGVCFTFTPTFAAYVMVSFTAAISALGNLITVKSVDTIYCVQRKRCTQVDV
ncbi:hypothetical protein ACHAXM_004276, partial [Skeletonema potamos]